MKVNEFAHRLRQMGDEEIRLVAKSIRTHLECAGDEVDHWRVTISIANALRHSRRSRQAAQSAYEVAQNVALAGQRAGRCLPDEEVTIVARAASEVARAMVAGPLTARELNLLMRDFILIL